MQTYSSRSTEFGYGSTGSQAAPIGIQRTSVLMPYMRSANAMSSADASRQTPYGQMPSPNDGYSKSTYDSKYTGVPTQVGY